MLLNNQSILIKKERNELYKTLLLRSQIHVEYLKSNYCDNNYYEVGLCNLIRSEIGFFSEDWFKDNLTELYNQKPEEEYDWLFWFAPNISGWMQRIRIIENAIKETENHDE